MNSSGDPSLCSNVQHGLVELWLLSTCEHLFLTHWSSFSWLSSGMSGTHPIIITANSCHRQPFSRPCYYELTHLKQLSCYNYDRMLRDDGCCQSEGFCELECLHHDAKYGSHSLYFLMVWPAWPLCKWLLKWMILLFFFMFLFGKIKLKWNLSTLMIFYQKLLAVILFLCILFVNIRSLFWSIIKIL